VRFFLLLLAKSDFSGIILAMEEEQKDEVFQAPKEFESRINRPRSNNNTKRYLVIILLIVVLGLLIFGVTRFFGGANKPKPTPTPAPTIEIIPTEEPTPAQEETTPTKKPTSTPTPKPTVNTVDKATGIDRSKLSIQVLNGSGTAGVGKKASDYLESLGYNVIQIGNAENFNFEKTTIQIKSGKESFLNLLKSDLAKNYSVGTTSADLASDQNADAVITVGKE